jgi:plasmid rolling circle replication initiator protein Rep
MSDKYSTKKLRNQGVFVKVDKHLPDKSKIRFQECGNWIEFLADREIAKKKVYQANFCKNRFCPICAWRSAQKDAMKLSILMEYIETEHEKDFIFVTFTAPNVKAEELRNEITRYNKAFKKLIERDVVVQMNKGYIRKLEITYNEKRNDYHPHFHVIFAVNKSYFTGRTYISQQTWLNLWREVMKDDTITQVDVRRVKRGKDVNEMAKYAAKDKDYTFSQEVFDVFYIALKGRQVLTYNGLFAAANKKYKNKELDHYKTKDETVYIWLILYHWGGSDYAEKWRKEVTQEEYQQLKKESEDEMSLG